MVWSILGNLHLWAKSRWLWYGVWFIFYEYLHTGFYTLMVRCGISAALVALFRFHFRRRSQYSFSFLFFFSCSLLLQTRMAGIY